MTKFVNWTTLATYGGAITFVMTLTQLTKETVFTKKIPTQLWSYILAFGVLLAANAFTTGLTLDVFAQTVLNAAIVSISANGGYSGVTKLKSGR